MVTIRNADGSIGLGAGGQYEDGAPSQLGPTAASYAPTVSPVLIETAVPAPPDGGVTIVPAGNTVGGRGIVLNVPDTGDDAPQGGGAPTVPSPNQPAPTPGTGDGPRTVPTSAGVIEGGAVSVAKGPTPLTGKRMLWASAAIIGGVFVLMAIVPRRKS
jgi:hypothetical protein